MRIVIEIPQKLCTEIKQSYSIRLDDKSIDKIIKAIRNSTTLEDTLKNFLEWYTLPFNDSLFKHTDEVIQEFIDYQKENTDADSD